MTRLDYQAPPPDSRWRLRPRKVLLVLITPVVTAAAAATASTLAKWTFQQHVGRTPLNGLPQSPRYQFFVEHLPFWGCTGLLACIVLWSVWRLFTRGDWLGFLLTAVASWFAWWGMLVIVVLNSFEAFP